MKRIAIAIFAAAFIGSAIGEPNEAVQKDLARLQGEWTMISGSADGEPLPEKMRQQMKRVCQADEVTTTMGGQLFLKARITLDPSKNPKPLTTI